MAIRVVYTQRIERAYLRLIDGALPPAWEKRRIGAEEEAAWAGDLEGLFEDPRQREPGVVGHPPVAARGVEIHVRREVGHEQRLTEESSAEVRNDEGHSWMVGGE